MIAIGGAVGLFLVENDRWEAVALHPWLSDMASAIRGDETREIWLWLPAVMAGWLAAVLLVGVIGLWSLFYVWRRRQYESLITRLERELVTLRNLPFTDPAPFEDIDERPSRDAAGRLARPGLGRGPARDAELSDVG